MGCKWAFMGYGRISVGNGGIMGNVSGISTGRATISDRWAIGGGVLGELVARRAYVSR